MATGSDYAVVRDTQGGVARLTMGLAVAAFVKFLVSTYHKNWKTKSLFGTCITFGTVSN